MLFQHQPYIDQDPLQLSQREVGAVLDAVCGTAGTPSAWGVCPRMYALACYMRSSSVLMQMAPGYTLMFPCIHMCHAQ